MARQFTKITPTTDNQQTEPKRRPSKPVKENKSKPKGRPVKEEKPPRERPLKNKKQKPLKEEKESKLGGFLNRNKTEDKAKSKSKPTRESSNKLRERKRTKEVDSQKDELVNKQEIKESKSFSVPSYLGYETLDITVAEPELDMYTKLILKTVKKKNSLGSINLIPLSKLSEQIEKLIAEFIYRGGGMDDDLLTEDDFEIPTQRESSNNSRVKAL